MIKISVVSYLNSYPFVYGLQNTTGIKNQIELQLDIPSVSADKLINKDVDIALVPVVVLKKINYKNIISDYCIGSDGQVNSVSLYSEVPINEIKFVYLDYQSSTSVELLKILLHEYWNINPILLDSNPGFESMIKGNKAGLVIGDRAFILNNKYKYIYDLSVIWKRMTNLPFVFAVWMSNNTLPKSFVNNFNLALSFGLNNIDKIVNFESNLFLSVKEIKEYLLNNISYNLDQEKKKSMDLFLGKISF